MGFAQGSADQFRINREAAPARLNAHQLVPVEHTENAQDAAAVDLEILGRRVLAEADARWGDGQQALHQGGARKIPT